MILVSQATEYSRGMESFVTPPIVAPLGGVTTERLELRPFQASDLDGLAVVFAKPEVWQFPYGRGFNRRQTETFLNVQLAHWDQCGFGCWVAVHRGEQKIIGFVGLSVPMFLPEILPAVEVGWRFDPSYWGRGLATEGAQVALQEGFETLGLDEITSVPQADNPPSSRVCERLGMTLDRVVSIPANQRRGALEALLYQLTRNDWEAKHQAADHRS